MNLKIMIKHITFRNIYRGTRYLFKNGPSSVIPKIKQVLKIGNMYGEWFPKHRITEEELEKQREYHFAYEPKISILVPTYRTAIPMLHEMIQSVINQSYANWELCIADGTMEDGELKHVLEKYQEEDSRIKVCFLEENLGISENTNRALELATGDFIGLLDHDDVLELDALFEVVKQLQDKAVDVVYTDEDKVSEDLKEFMDPNFKPDLSIDLLRSHNYITHFLVIKKEIMDNVGAFNKECDGAQDYDLVLRCVEVAQKVAHVPKILYHWRMCKGSTADNPQNKMYCYEAGKLALENHLRRCGIEATVEHAGRNLWGLYHVKYHVIGNPLVSIVIANKDHAKDLNKCIKSLEEVNIYKNIEIIVVENNSEEKSTFEYYDSITKEYDNIRVIMWQEEFNYSAINNYGVKEARGEYILLLNNDTELITPNAIEEMLGICQREDVGIVGAKLLYADETIQHAGVVIGFGGYAGHVFHGLRRYDYGFMMRPRINCNYSAVTAACLMTKKSIFEQVNGLSEEYKVACNDVDYCLKVRKLDKLVVYAAFAEWFHYESKSRGYEDTPEKKARFEREVAKFQSHWGDILESGDPFYNRNFPVTVAPFTLDMRSE